MDEPKAFLKLMDWAVAALTGALGFILALVTVLLGKLFSMGQWFFAVILILLFVGVLVLDKLFDAIFDPIFNRIFRMPKIEGDAHETDHRLSRYAFVAGFALATVASWIWSAEAILDLI